MLAQAARLHQGGRVGHSYRLITLLGHRGNMGQLGSIWDDKLGRVRGHLAELSLPSRRTGAGVAGYLVPE